MKIKERVTARKIIALTLSSLLPLGAIVVGIIFIFSNIIFDTAFVLGFFVIPLLTMLLSFLLIFSKRKRSVKLILNTLLLIIFVFIFLVTYLMFKHEMLDKYTNDDVAEHYTEIANNFKPMPGLNEIGFPENISYYDYFSQEFIFDEYAFHLICKYDEVEYKEQKALIEDNYIFQEETISDDRSSIDPTVEIGGYLFRALSVNGGYGNEINYPKRLIFIATNDETSEIVYMAFYDDDLDYIKSLKDFINDNCGWKHIR